MTAAAVDPVADGKAYWILDDATPPLADLLTHVGRHLGVKVPRVRMPIGVIKRLPQRITKADPETLTFMSADRYPTDSAIEFAARHGIPMPDVLVSLERWADHLAAHRFGAVTADGRRFADVGGLRTFELGVARSSRVVFPGLPVNADTWAEVASGIGARVVDLPGLGLSGGTGVQDWEKWLPAVLGGEPADLIGHSIGAAAAVVAADRLPGAGQVPNTDSTVLSPGPDGWPGQTAAARVRLLTTRQPGAAVTPADRIRRERGCSGVQSQ